MADGLICRWCGKPIDYHPPLMAGMGAAVWSGGNEANGFYCYARRNATGKEWHEPDLPNLRDPDHVAAWLDGRPYQPKRTGFAIAA